MQIVKACTDAEVFDTSGVSTYHLATGGEYLLHDQEAGFGLRDGALELVKGLDRVVRHYTGQVLESHRLVVPFAGRSGDALVLSACIAALVERYPGITVDVAAPAAARDVLSLTPRVGELLDYPMQAGALDRYDYYLCFETIDAVADGTSRSCMDVFSSCLHTPRPKQPSPLIIPPEAADRWRLPSTDRSRVAVQIGTEGNLRTYPMAHTGELSRRLVDAGFEVFLMGSGEQSQRNQLESFPGVHNLCGKTPAAADLAALLAQMDLVVSSDSFPLHMASALGLPVIALFASTNRAIASDYSTVLALQSAATCSPCGQAQGDCPLKYATCIAWDDESVSPAALVAQAREHLQTVCAELQSRKITSTAD